MKLRKLLLLAAAASLPLAMSACDDEGGEDPAGDMIDVSGDATGDTTTTPDTADDTAMPPDTTGDTAMPPDTTGDTAMPPDTTGDTVIPDTMGDTVIPDTMGDTVIPDTMGDTTMAECGNGVSEPGELCDGNCPVTCNDGNACTVDTMSGAPETCDVACSNDPVVDCTDADGCCPVGCDSTTDNDCSASCGNGVIEAGETCDGNCPADCDDGIACTTDTMTGSTANCNVACSHVGITMCQSGDGCCPAGCTAATDDDCSSTCGDGVVDTNAGETCDGNCPTSCNDGIACTTDTLQGSAANCNAECTYTQVTQCQDGDSCCPAGCTQAADNDCNPTGQVGDECTSGGECVAGGCIDEANFGWPGGYCTSGCAVDADCPTGSDCSSGVVCTVSCTSDNECRTGYGCEDDDGDGDSECVPTAAGPGAPGDPCQTVADCSGGSDGLCVQPDAAPGFQDGFCSIICSTANPCPGGSHCGQIDPDTNTGLCLPDCGSDADCRTGYACQDSEQDAADECWPTASGTGDVGDPCVGVFECAGGDEGFCFGEGQSWNDGYCTLDCGQGNPCPQGTHCLINDPQTMTGVCLLDCAGNADCRADGYQCYDADGEGTDECFPAGTGTGQTGDACEGVWDCVGGPNALCIQDPTAWPGGYCSVACGAGQGTCTGDAVCFSFTDGQACLDGCTATTDCRDAEGYECLADGMGNNVCGVPAP